MNHRPRNLLRRAAAGRRMAYMRFGQQDLLVVIRSVVFVSYRETE